MMTKLNEYPKEGETMSDSSLNATEIAVGSLLAGGRGNYGGGYGGAWSGGGYGGSANGAYSIGANAVRIDSADKAAASGLENLLDQNQFSATNKNIVDGFSRAADARSDNVHRVSDQQFRSELRMSDQFTATTKVLADAEFRSLDRQRDTDKTLAAMAAANALCCCDTKAAIAEAAKEAAKCCCDAQLAACKSHAEITATVLADGALTREMIRGDALSAANAKITQLETVNALSHSYHR